MIRGVDSISEVGADANHGIIELATLGATAVAFLMALGIPEAFADGQGLWLVVPYVAARVFGLSIYLAIAWPDAANGPLSGSSPPFRWSDS